MLTRGNLAARFPAAALIAGLAACSGDVVTAGPDAPELPANTALLECTVSVGAASLRCADTGPSAGGARGAIYGGQGSVIKLANTPVSVTKPHPDTVLMSTEVTVKNLLRDQAIGTVDSVTVDTAGIKVFYYTGPTVTAGSGFVQVAGQDGEAAFLNGPAPFYRYPQMLAPNATSAGRTWKWKVAPTVQSFTFKVYVSTAVQARIVINEIMLNPREPLQDSVAEYVELYNSGRFALNLQGFILSDNTAGFSDTIKSALMIGAGRYLLLGRSRNATKNGGLVPDYVYTSRFGTTSPALSLDNSGPDFFVIKAPTAVTVDSVFYATDSTPGFSRELKFTYDNNESVHNGNWQSGTRDYDPDYESYNYGSPRRVNPNNSL
ncbi:MAG TPA: lamin tail domain-containing protein [Longimicrobium sp.]|jgi:hypothetical protein|uniref:lamin tail domain-containing protein n=1 Tax=Longimicrobium sp. TaxID=2029185 RepID=UPI002EDB2D6F